MGFEHVRLQRAITLDLRERGCLVTPSGSTNGQLDLVICMPNGVYAELDIKCGRDRLSALQQDRIKEIRGIGGIASEVRSRDAAIALIPT